MHKKILVTGGNGYLGNFLVKALQEAEADVFIISKNAKNDDRNFFHAAVTFCFRLWSSWNTRRTEVSVFDA